MSHSASSSRPPLVGRDHELSLLRAVEDARHGHGALVWISGEPGVGKTRLAQEIGALIAGSVAGRLAVLASVDTQIRPLIDT